VLCLRDATGNQVMVSRFIGNLMNTMPATPEVRDTLRYLPFGGGTLYRFILLPFGPCMESAGRRDDKRYPWRLLFSHVLCGEACVPRAKAGEPANEKDLQIYEH
jgi:hypothetical protein